MSHWIYDKHKKGGAELFSFANPSRDALLERAKAFWRTGQWRELSSIEATTLQENPHKEKIAILVAAAHHQLDDERAARTYLQMALAWGCPDWAAVSVFAAGVHNTLGKAAGALKDAEAQAQHFAAAAHLAGDVDSDDFSRQRAVRELATIGIFEQAVSLINLDLWRTKKTADREISDARMKVLQTELALLNEELTTAIRRGQLYRSQGSADDGGADDEADLRKASTSQLGQDLWVLSQVGGKREGFFVEFGATDGVALSNTWLLETALDWNGLLAEPNPKFLSRLRANRTATVTGECIAGHSGEQVEFVFADVFGGIAKFADDDEHAARRQAYRETGNAVMLRTISLDEFLEKYNAPKDIDYISVDTEGSEYEILKTFPFKKWNVKCWTVEHNFTEYRDKIFELMRANGYTRVEAQWDDWYYK